MQKKILATAFAFTLSAPAMALEVYQDETNRFSVGGRLGVKTDSRDTTLENDSSRINFSFNHKLNEMVSGYALAEWGFRATNEYEHKDGNSSSKELFSNRLGYVGVKHEQLGAVQIGKQWSVYYDVSGWTDAYPIGGGKAMGIYEGYSGDGGINGTGRADDALSYRGGFAGFNVGLQYQFKDSAGTVTGKDDLTTGNGWSRQDGGQISLTYDFEFGLSLGYSYSQTQFEERDPAKAQAVGFKFSNEQFYLAGTYGQFENQTNAVGSSGVEPENPGIQDRMKTGFDKKSKGYELFGRFELPQVPGLGLYAGLNVLEIDESGTTFDSKELGKLSEGKLDHKTLGVVYVTGPLQFAVEYTINDSKDHTGKGKADDYVNVQARYYF